MSEQLPDGSYVAGENPPCEGCAGVVTHAMEYDGLTALLCEACAFTAEDVLLARGKRNYRLIWLGIDE